MQIPPSSPASANQAAPGLELTPFRGVRYAQDRVSGLAEVTSPPYDVIFGDKEDQLMAADPHNVVRLILPRPVPGRPGEEYHDAAESLRQWQDEHILVTDPAPALYLYEQSAASGPEPGWVQRGLIGAIRLVPPEAGIVLPHEDVAPGPVAGRLALMEATQANLEPIFLLYDSLGATPAGEAVPNPCNGAVGATAKIIAQIAGSCEGSSPREPLISTCTPDGLRHKLWAITEPDELAAIADDLGPRQALIADGHHRYAAYRQLQARRRQAGDGPGPWDYGLALLVDSASYPPQIGAIHRVIPGFDVQQAVKLAADRVHGARASRRCVSPASCDQCAVVGERIGSGVPPGGRGAHLPDQPARPGSGRRRDAGRPIGAVASAALRGTAGTPDHQVVGPH